MPSLSVENAIDIYGKCESHAINFVACLSFHLSTFLNSLTNMHPFVKLEVEQ